MRLPHIQDSSTSRILAVLTTDFTRDILRVVDNRAVATKDLVFRAKRCLRGLRPEDTIAGFPSIKAYTVLQAMLNYAPCDRGQRYVACAIIRPNRVGKPLSSQLIELAGDWFKFFILPFYQISKHPSPPQSEEATPRTFMDVFPSPLGSRIHSPFRAALTERQGGKCAFIDAPGLVIMEAAHVIKQPFAICNPPVEFYHIHCTVSFPYSKQTPEMAITLDIIQHYANIPLDMLVDSVIDSPANGILMEKSVHIDFSNFLVCLEPIGGESNRYTAKWINGEPIWTFDLAEQKIIDFNSRTDLAPPDPAFLALHASLAHIIRGTEIGAYLGTFLDPYLPKDEESSVMKSDPLHLTLLLALGEVFSSDSKSKPRRFGQSEE